MLSLPLKKIMTFLISPRGSLSSQSFLKIIMVYYHDLLDEVVPADGRRQRPRQRPEAVRHLRHLRSQAR